jgi:hypothetical protein
MSVTHHRHNPLECNILDDCRDCEFFHRIMFFRNVMLLGLHGFPFPGERAVRPLFRWNRWKDWLFVTGCVSPEDGDILNFRNGSKCIKPAICTIVRALYSWSVFPYNTIVNDKPNPIIFRTECWGAYLDRRGMKWEMSEAFASREDSLLVLFAKIN